jgi:acetyl-CoA carboxylase carboxyltransferase component
MSTANLPDLFERPDPLVRQRHAVRRVEPLATLAPMHERRVPSTGGVRPRRTSATMHDHVDRLRADRRSAVDGPGELATKRQHERGKLTARERLELLLDAGTFVELDLFVRHRSVALGLADHRPATDGVVTGWGRIHDRVVFVFSHDFRIFGGSLGEVFAAKIQKVMDMAASVGAPLIGLNDGAGARIQEGVAALAGYAGIFRRSVRSSGVIPQISVILGPCAGGAAYSPALTDFVGMVRGTSQMFLTGPDVIATVTGESVTSEVLGGAAAHAARSGVASFVADDETECLEAVRHLVSFLPSNNMETPPYYPPEDRSDRRCDELLDIVPASPRQGYDVHRVIEAIVDDGEMLEIQPEWARNIVCGLARLDGHVVGIVANQPNVLAGALDIDSSDKAARFVRMCDAFNIPIVTFVDVPGFLPGVQQEHDGIIRHGAKLLYAYAEATVPRIQVILRKAFGGAYIVMDSKPLGADLCLAWPSNEVAVMGAEAAANVIFKREIAGADDPDARRSELTEQYVEACMHPYAAAELGLVDDVIDPRETRQVLVQALAMLRSKREELPARKHGTMPL